MPDRSKMTVIAFDKPDFTGSPKGTYTVLVNPEKYTQSYKIIYDKTGAIGGRNSAAKSDRSPPPTMRFELLFDGTGVITNSPTDVAAEIAAFQRVVYAYDGESHSPSYLKIHWGTMTFGARLTEMTVNYTLFRADGSPLRARADVTFVNHVAPASIQLQQDRHSRNLTRQVRVRTGDTLPVMTYRMYCDTRYYLEVARANNLADFRHLQPGTVITFPPLS